MSSLADAAAAYSASGLVLVPLMLPKDVAVDERDPRKRPLGKAWQTKYVAPHDPEDARRAWSTSGEYAGRGFGVHLGPSGVVSLDVDDLAAARTALAAVGYDVNELLDAGARILSPKENSRRSMFRAPEGVDLPTQKLRWASGMVLELRAGAGLHDCLPPSVHPLGEPYQWDGFEPGDPLPEPPPRLLALWLQWGHQVEAMRQVDPDYEPPVERSPTPPDTHPPVVGGCSKKGWEEVRREIRRRLPAEGMMTRLTGQTGSRKKGKGAPGERTFFSCYFHPPDKDPSFYCDGETWVCQHGTVRRDCGVGNDLPKGVSMGDSIDLFAWAKRISIGQATLDLARELGIPLPEPDQQAASEPCAATCAGWPKPLPLADLGSEPPGEFPLEVLPAWAAAYAEAQAVALQMPLEAVALAILAALAGGAQRVADVWVGKGWVEPLSFYKATGLPPAAKKSPLMTDIKRPVITAARMMRESLRELRAEIEAEARAIELRIKAEELRLKKDPGASSATLALLIQEREAVLAGAPPIVRYLVDDATPEALVRILERNGGYLCSLSAEAPLIAVMSGCYGKGNTPPNLGIILCAHAGDAYPVDRVGVAQPITIEQPRLSLGLMTQPEMLRQLLAIAGAEARGLLGRFTLSLPQHGLGTRQVNPPPPPVPSGITARYEDEMRNLWCADAGQRAQIKLSPAARAVIDEFNGWIEPQLADGGQLAEQRARAGKAAGLAARVAGISYVADGRRGLIEAEDAAAGVAFAKWSLRSSAHAARAAVIDVDTDRARHVLAVAVRLATEHGTTQVPRQDLWQDVKGRKGIKKAAGLDAALALLESHGWVRLHSVPQAGRARRTVEVSPLALEGRAC